MLTSSSGAKPSGRGLSPSISVCASSSTTAARVVAPQFAGISRVQQHKLVYEALGGRMGGVLHALQLTTAVPTGEQEYRPPSPARKEQRFDESVRP